MVNLHFPYCLRPKKFVAILFFLAIICPVSGAKADKKRPNIILIMSDDQGWGDLSINGNPDVQTPHIDQIAANGARFDNFYVSPVCSPTRAELLTGRYHPRTGVYSTSEGGERINLDETTMAEIFRASGYQTAAFGKWHNGMQYPYHPNARGFQEFYGFCSGHWGNYFSPLLEHNGKIVQGEGFIIDDLTNKAIDFIEQNSTEPFFVYLPYNTPHSPMQVPDAEWGRFKEKELTLHGESRNGQEDLNFTRAALALCENIDKNVGRIQQTVDRLNLGEHTIIIYLSDNGPNAVRWNNGLKGIKGSTNEGGVKSPMLIQWLGKIDAGKRILQRAAAIDLLPTLAELASLDLHTPKPLDGLSLAPLLLTETIKWPDRLLFTHWNGRVAVRNQQYFLDDEGQLYDLLLDPGQTRSLTPNHTAVTRALKDTLYAWKNELLKDMPQDIRPFPVGHPNFKYTQLPARDAKSQGGIIRSSRHPNSSYFTNWTHINDAISWDIEVLSAGDYEVTVYYSSLPQDLGATMELSAGQSTLSFEVEAPRNGLPINNDILNKRYDRVERKESYELDFKPLNAGTIHLAKGRTQLLLKALNIPHEKAMEFRLINLTRK
ncbi:arylsulfatase [Dyadobacter tibetensis]|uniref:arylsulfatase n=1 Tax=Dyadobacter tibetensis TaxID=1211851 RepID=UPI000472000A|nr:arylsulfatase [Dyadobacter tibetensis]